MEDKSCIQEIADTYSTYEINNKIKQLNEDIIKADRYIRKSEADIHARQMEKTELMAIKEMYETAQRIQKENIES